ncbi:mannose-1-phosphate guanylyltransferase/mannose-6-phosphate isomerase [Archaeoglobus fulgidus]|uniref:mannose-1-phosphate guanylyltransferase n=2 Tax=Archaeoglobus fulgidus TaxID=2234 RepID=O29168_ARCFU|nr:mannose-1-phosphate guanylyltransferase/mannose-6-phosphate isomerase [Archaeoglobus fulgidus]AAB90149.1 mannose-6-phosphate isomerase/mannose-1-phosphate guanylyl transferase (manC) [Archaeoglobus fulgidus DSM 4304]AIG97973.1 mannose-1-phosphate guanylyltransferase/mannose-6-phosphate isomerase [Archaeoglobus fulgidus DSM 8774]
MKTLILAGGKGTRLWPLSRELMPKQFIKLFSESLFQKTVKRALYLSSPDEIYVITNKEYRFRVLDDLEEIGISIPEENIILEPEAKNTLPAICLGVKAAGEGKFAVLPSDHLIKADEEYLNAFRSAEKLSENYIVTFGITPTRPHTGYGYIKPGKELEGGFEVEQFKEKPSRELAEEYVSKGYLWNSGMFVFDSKVFVEELKELAPEFAKVLEEGEEAYKQIPEASFDYAILEKSGRVAVVPIKTFWSDLGNFDSIYEVMEKDERGNAIKSESCIPVDSENNLVITQRLTALIGLRDLIVIDTDDALLVARRGEAEKVREVYRLLAEKGDKAVEVHRTAHRPWGSYTVLEENKSYKIKRITVKPKKRLSLQRHYHRSEHWVVVKGTARIVVDGNEILLRSGESTFVPAGAIHRIENPGKIPLEIIEIQIGEYLEEDDIERFEDDFGRR